MNLAGSDVIRLTASSLTSKGVSSVMLRGVSSGGVAPWEREGSSLSSSSYSSEASRVISTGLSGSNP